MSRVRVLTARHSYATNGQAEDPANNLGSTKKLGF